MFVPDVRCDPSLVPMLSCEIEQLINSVKLKRFGTFASIHPITVGQSYFRRIVFDHWRGDCPGKPQRFEGTMLDKIFSNRMLSGTNA
jgi:hypothetical protein